MIIRSFELYSFKVPLISPLKIKNKKITDRQGLIIKISDEKMNIGIGEISPLPGIHSENLADIFTQTEFVLNKLLNIKIPEIFNELLIKCEIWFSKYNTFPSVQFGIESAIIYLIASNKNMSIFELMNTNPTKSIKINALLNGTKEQIITKTIKYLSRGFTTFKLKVGRKTLIDDIEIINSLNNLLNGKALLRLDVNQLWTLEDAIYIFKHIRLQNIEYVEEPLQTYQEIPELFKEISIPVALDENIKKIQLNSKPPDWLHAIILKPTVIGSYNSTIQYINFAEQFGRKAVISDTFQTGTGLTFLMALANFVRDKAAMGLDTYSWIKKDILKNRHEILNGNLIYKMSNNLNNNLNYSELTNFNSIPKFNT